MPSYFVYANTLSVIVHYLSKCLALIRRSGAERPPKHTPLNPCRTHLNRPIATIEILPIPTVFGATFEAFF